VARDGYDQDDLDFSAAKFLWATFKAHAVMAILRKVYCSSRQLLPLARSFLYTSLLFNAPLTYCFGFVLGYHSGVSHL